MPSYKVEYLSVINSKENFCKSISSFNNLLQTYDNVTINGNSIEYENVSFGYDVQYGEITENTERFFHVKLNCPENTNLEIFRGLLKCIRTLLTQASKKPPEILWDDTSSELANKAYPIIHETENMMRKLITKFMLTTIGLTWTKDTVPKEVSESIKTNKTLPSKNYLYESDFIQLSNFLFKEYSTANSRKLVEKLDAASDISELDLSELKELVPQSNWERYFSPIVDCNSAYLQTRWERLYELRCMVAHSKFLGVDEYEEILKFSTEVKEKLTQAIDNLDTVHVSADQKEDVAENIASSMNTLYGEFIRSWNLIQDLLAYLYNLKIDDSKDISMRKRRMLSVKQLIKPLIDNKIIPKDYMTLLYDLSYLRNQIVHQSNFRISEEYLKEIIGDLDRLKVQLREIVEKNQP